MSGGIVARIPIIPLLLVIIPVQTFFVFIKAAEIGNQAAFTNTVGTFDCNITNPLTWGSCVSVAQSLGSAFFLADIGFPIYIQIPLAIIIDSIDLLILIALFQGFIP